MEQTLLTSEKNGDIGEIEQIADFKKGYNNVFEQLTSLAASAQKGLGSSVVTDEIRPKLAGASKEIDQALSTIQAASRQLLLNLQGTELEREATREFHNFFTDSISDHRIEYIVFMKSYALIKAYNLETHGLWSQIKKLVDEAEIPRNSDFYQQVINYRVVPAMRMGESIRVFTARMSVVLGITHEPGNLKNLGDIGRYSPDLSYQLSTVFVENLAGFIAEQLDPPEHDVGEHDNALPDALHREDAPKQPDAPKESHELDTAGAMPWNRGTHYYFAYDPKQLELERKVYTSIIHIDTHMGADSDMIRSDIIRKYSRRTQTTDLVDIENKYTHFLHSYFELIINISMMNLNIPSDLKYKFLYHLGPNSFYHLTRKFLQEAETGTFQRKVGKMIKKYIPVELTRKIILEWWRAHVLEPLGEDIDNYSAYRQLARHIKHEHGKLSQKAMAEVKAMSPEQRNNRTQSEIVRENLNKWFGATNIIIFKRYLKAHI